MLRLLSGKRQLFLSLLSFSLIYGSSQSYFAPRICAAQQVPVAELEPVVVTASAFPTKYDDLPATVTIITRAEIEAQKASRISEVLTQVPGLHIDEMGGRGGLSSVYIRGGDPNFTTVMVDGIQINDPTNPRGGSVDLSNLTPDNIERIEVIRGPASSLYGSDPMAGIINIVTRRGQKDTRYKLLAEAGSYGHARGVMQTSGSHKSVNYSGSFAFDRNDAQVKKDRFNLGSAGLNLDLVDFQNSSLRLTTEYRHIDTRVFPEGSGGSRFAVLRDTERRHAQEFLMGLHLSRDANLRMRHDLQAGVFYRNQAVESPGVQAAVDLFRIPPANFDTAYIRYQLLWKTNFQLTPQWAIAGGTQITGERGTRDGIQKLTVIGAPDDLRSEFKMTRYTPAAFLETNVSPIDTLKLTAGLRGDLPENFNLALSPKLGLSYRVTSMTTMRANFGKAFKLPSIHALGDPLIGNSKLEPETSLGGDVGVEHKFNQNKHSLGLTYFRNRFSHLIDLDPDLARQGVFQLVNLTSVSTEGLEANVKFRPIDAVRVHSYFTYLHSDIKGSDQPLRNRPRFSGGLVLEGEPYDSLVLRAKLNVTGRKFDLQIPTRRDSTGGYAKADLAMTFSPSKSWRLFCVLENVTNTKYEDYIGFRSPGTNFRFGLVYEN